MVSTATEDSRIRTDRIECLDGLRGLAALWVLVGHVMWLTGWRVPVVTPPDLGVDLFILISGFLMVLQYRRRQHREPWSAVETWMKFWTRRFFRVAPLYYLALGAALGLGPRLFASRHTIDAFLGSDPQLASRYIDFGVANIAAHVTFLFGLSPTYSYRTALPDWSIGLEMQFYAVFPFLMLILARTGWPIGVTALAGAAAAVAYSAQAHGAYFAMPSFLPLKLQIFLCGMVLAAAFGQRRSTGVAYLLLAMGLTAIPFGTDEPLLKREILLLVFATLVLHGGRGGRVGTVVDRVSATLGNRFFSWLGEMSFGVYLVHLLILQPVVAALIEAFGHYVGAAARFAMAAAITVPLSYAVAWGANLLVERPGQAVGRRLLRRVELRSKGFV